MFAGLAYAMHTVVAFIAAIFLVVTLGVAIVRYIVQWKIFEKAGEPGWKSLIPFLNGHTMHKLFWKPLYYWLTQVLVVIVSVLLTVLMVMSEGFDAGRTYPMVFSSCVWGLYFVFVIVTIVWSVKLNLGMARSFGYGAAFAAGLVLLPLVFQLILAFGNDAYRGNTYPKAEEGTTPPGQEPWNRPPV